MNHFSQKIIAKNILTLVGFFILSFFFFQNTNAQTISNQPLHINSVEKFDIYPLFEDNTPGICIDAVFFSPQVTGIAARFAPFATINNPTWQFIPNLGSQGGGSFGILGAFSSTLNPSTEYIFQYLEKNIVTDEYHFITPNVQTDDISTVCTPNSQGQLTSECPVGDFVLTTCSQDAINAALQASGNLESYAEIINSQSGQDSLTFDVNTQGLEGDIILLYTTSLQDITNNFQAAQNINISVSATSPLSSISLSDLQTNATYYVTVLDVTGSVIINTSSNQPYEVLTTGSQNTDNDSSNSNPVSDINVNIGDSFVNSEVQQETDAGLVQCGFGEVYDCDFNALLATIDRIIKFAIYIIILPLAAILFAIAAIRLIIASAKSKQAELTKAKNMLLSVLIGLAFVFGAWIIVKFILIILGYTDSGIISQILGITLTE